MKSDNCIGKKRKAIKFLRLILRRLIRKERRGRNFAERKAETEILVELESRIFVVVEKVK